MLSRFLIASAVFLQVVTATKYYCDSGEAMCCTDTTTVSSGLSDLIGYGCSAIVAASDGSVSGCITETVCCTGPQYYEFALIFVHRTGQITVNCTVAVSV
ncbi:hypothetical protein EDB19DRAFT_1793363 [Suillus lakei]|nr:hypothetical protein EDB19DRAFT_1793363 [Suillus lakei]